MCHVAPSADRSSVMMRRWEARREVGYLTYAKRQLSPYLRACVDQFSQQRPTLTQRLLARTRKN